MIHEIHEAEIDFTLILQFDSSHKSVKSQHYFPIHHNALIGGKWKLLILVTTINQLLLLNICFR